LESNLFTKTNRLLFQQNYTRRKTQQNAKHKAIHREKKTRKHEYAIILSQHSLIYSMYAHHLHTHQMVLFTRK